MTKYPRNRSWIIPLVIGLLTGISPASTRALLIQGTYIGPGVLFPVADGGGGNQPANATGGGNLTAIFNSAAALWETKIQDNFTVQVNYGWAPLSGSVLGVTTAWSSGGSPERILAADLQIDNDGSSVWFLDPTPSDSSEWNTYTESSKDLGAGTVNVGRAYSSPNTTAAGNVDLFTVVLHELGHALGLASNNPAYRTETAADNAINVTGPRPMAGSTIATNNSGPVPPGTYNAHLNASVFPSSLMKSTTGFGDRRLMSDADILAIAQVSQFTSVNLTPSWKAAGGGNWSAAANWTGASLPPNAADAEASFGMGTSSAIVVDVPVTVGRLTFLATNACTISGSAGITMQTTSGPAVIDLQRALTQTVTAPLLLASSTNITGLGTLAAGSVTNNASLSVQATVSVGNLDGTGGTTLGAGQSLTANDIRQNQLGLGDGATVLLRANGTDANFTRVGALALGGTTNAWTSKIDVNDNKVILANANSAADAATYTRTLNQIKQAAHFDPTTNDGDGAFLWDGQGITSTKVNTEQNVNGNFVMLGVLNNDDGTGNPAFYGDGTPGGLPQFAGQSVNGTDVLVKYTYNGDADLSGTVDSVDFALFRFGFLHPGGTAGGWMNGDFNYDGVIDSVDFALFRFAFLHQGAPLDGGGDAGSSGPTPRAVPEPASLVLLSLGGLLMLKRTSRKN